MDYKTQLQELVQQKKDQVIQYELTGQSGPDHAKQFQVEVRLQRLRGGAGDWQQQKTGGAGGGAGCHGKAVSSGTVRRNACETVESHTLL